MNVTRDVEGATSWVGAMSGIKHKHDSFGCPNYDEDWHMHLISLLESITGYGHSVKSKAIQRIVEKEIRLIRSCRDMKELERLLDLGL